MKIYGCVSHLYGVALLLMLLPVGAWPLELGNIEISDTEKIPGIGTGGTGDTKKPNPLIVKPSSNKTVTIWHPIKGTIEMPIDLETTTSNDKSSPPSEYEPPAIKCESSKCCFEIITENYEIKETRNVECQ